MNAQTIPPPDDRKFEELMLHIAQRSANDRRFGATKLNKLLFYGDFLAYLYFGQPITAHRYQALPQGPAPIALLPVLRRMEEEKAAVVTQSEHYGFMQKRLVALRDPNYDLFSAQEIALIDRLIEDFWNLTAKQISEHSHQLLAWQVARPSEEIPYTVALVGSRRPTAEEAEHGMGLEEKASELLTQAG